MKEMKMNTLLGKLDHSSSVFNKEVADYTNYFKRSQGAFRGEKKTYTPREGYSDDPSKVGNMQVQTTVNEQFEWMAKIAKNYLDDTLSIEATNSTGAKRVPLAVDGVYFGDLTALELMRLKSILTSKELIAMFENIPVRSDSIVWNKTQNENYVGRDIYETMMEKGVSRTTESEDVILKDPNIDPANLPGNYRSPIVQKKKVIEIGDYTRQQFSGEWTQRQKAELLNRRSKLVEAVNIALKVVNDELAVETNVNVDKLINFINFGKE